MRRRLFLVAGKEHPLAKRESVKVQDLRGYHLIFQNTNATPQAQIDEALIRQAITPEIQLKGADYSLALNLCATNGYIAFFAGPPESYPGLRRIDLEDLELYWTFNIIVNRHSYLNEAVNRFIAYTRQCLG
jgi:DNA-binding transcriptional LysR family regulator